MANSYSRIGNGNSQQKFTSAEPRYREQQILFAQGSWDHIWKDEGKLEGKTVRRRTSQTSSPSDISSTDTRRSSLESTTSYQRSAGVVPASPGIPLPWSLRTMDSSGSLEIYHTPLEWNPSPLILDPTEMRVSPTEAQRSQSPRNQMNEFQGQHRDFGTEGPLDRYLAQAHEFRDLDDGSKGVDEEWKRLRSLRANLLRRRAHLRSKRKELQEKQIAKSSADEAFMKYVRTHRSTGTVHPSSGTRPTDEILDALFSAMQTSRDEYGSLEYDYNVLEDTIDEEEFELAMSEGRLYTIQAQKSPNLDLKPATTKSAPLLSEPLLTPNVTVQYHPLHESYLSRLGDLDLLRERHQNMLRERQNLLSTQESRALLSIELQEHVKDFLSRFSAEEAALQGLMVQAEEDIEGWRGKCIAEGIDINESLYESPSGSELDDGWEKAYPPQIADEDTLLQTSQSSHTIELSMFSVLLPKSKEEMAKLGDLITDFNEGNKSDRINRWMQYQLQTSPLEIELLFRVSYQFFQVMDFYHWQICVLSWWAKDGANKSGESFNAAQTHSSMQKSHCSTCSSRSCSRSVNHNTEKRQAVHSGE